MSEYDAHDDERRHEPEPRPEARVHLAKWSPWIWIVPALAIFFAGYLVVRYGFFGGGDITVRFAEARGLDRYSPVRFRGAKVGTVQKITIDKNLRQVVVRISMDASMNHALRKGTAFWIEEPGLEGGGIGGLLSGTYVGIAPGEGDKTRDFTGQEYAPVLPPPVDGKTFILVSHGLDTVAAGSPVQFNGIRVGRILGAEYNEAQRVTEVHAFVVQRFADHVRAGDLAMLEYAAAGDADGFYRQVVQESCGPGMAGDSMAVGGPRRICGLAPIYALLRLAERDNGVVLHYDQWIDQGGAGSVTFGCVVFD